LIPTRLAELNAFCATCPPDCEVTALLKGLGFTLDFQRPAKRYRNCPSLPAQFHYRDEQGTEVIFLAGKDTPDGIANKHPNHASRWWIYPGNSQYGYTLAVKELAQEYQLSWK